MFSHLNQPVAETSYSDAVWRAIGHLGDYVELLVRPLNLRPTGAVLLSLAPERVEVRVNSRSGNVVVAIGPDADIAGEIAWLRALATRSLPAARIIHADLSGTLAPFSYVILAFAGGIPLASVEDPTLVKVAARAAGRALRRVHQIPAPAFGRPSPADRWPLHGWRETLRGWLEESAALQFAADILGPQLLAEVFNATLDHADIACNAPRMIHGALSPQRVLVTTGESIQLEQLFRPGTIIAGDPLLDVAQALLPTQPPSFRQGFLEGYAAVGPLDPSQRQKLRRLGILARIEAAARSSDVALRERLPMQITVELGLLGAVGLDG